MHQKKILFSFFFLSIFFVACNAFAQNRPPPPRDGRVINNYNVPYNTYGSPYSSSFNTMSPYPSTDYGAFNTSSTNQMNQGSFTGYYNLNNAYAYPNRYYPSQDWGPPPLPLPPPPPRYNQQLKERQEIKKIKEVPLPQLSPNEVALFETLSVTGRSIYQSLDSPGKALALQLAGENGYQNKELAVKEAQRRMNERNGGLFRRSFSKEN